LSIDVATARVSFMSAELCATQYAARHAAAALDFLFLATAQIFDTLTFELKGLNTSLLNAFLTCLAFSLRNHDRFPSWVYASESTPQLARVAFGCLSRVLVLEFLISDYFHAGRCEHTTRVDFSLLFARATFYSLLRKPHKRFEPINTLPGSAPPPLIFFFSLPLRSLIVSGLMLSFFTRPFPDFFLLALLLVAMTQVSPLSSTGEISRRLPAVTAATVCFLPRKIDENIHP